MYVDRQEHTSKGIDGGPSQGRSSHASGSCGEGGLTRESSEDVLEQQGLASPSTACEEDTVSCTAQTSM